MTRVQALSLIAAGLAPCALAGLQRATPAPWLINETPSLPRGLYVRSLAPPAPGGVVAVRPPAAVRPYLASLGAPAEARLLKRVAAGPGETICREGRWLTWPRGEVIALDHDRRGRALAAWRGCRRLGAEELLVVGDSAASFDSRYFGPVRLGAVEGVYKEAWRW
jgi:type IV secretory pathway protease TraF